VASVVVLAVFASHDLSSKPTAGEWAMLLFFPIGLSCGLLVSWWKELLGSCITLASLLLFYAVFVARAGTLPRGAALFAVFALPSLASLASAMLRRDR
jgi:hypothetical protein